MQKILLSIWKNNLVCCKGNLTILLTLKKFNSFVKFSQCCTVTCTRSTSSHTHTQKNKIAFVPRYIPVKSTQHHAVYRTMHLIHQMKISTVNFHIHTSSARQLTENGPFIQPVTLTPFLIFEDYKDGLGRTAGRDAPAPHAAPHRLSSQNVTRNANYYQICQNVN